MELGRGAPPLFAVVLNSIKKDSLLVENHDLSRARLAQKLEQRADTVAFTEDRLKTNSRRADPRRSRVTTCSIHGLIAGLTCHAARAATHGLIAHRGDSLLQHLLLVNILLLIVDHVQCHNIHRLDNVILLWLHRRACHLTGLHRRTRVGKGRVAIHLRLGHQNFIPALKALVQLPQVLSA